MKRIIIAGMLVIVIILSSCGRTKGSFMDFAAVKDAERTMIRLSNLMEQYYVEHSKYPLNQEQFIEGIKPYFITYNRDNEAIDRWDELVKNVFADGMLYYETKDPLKSYFIYGRAMDSNGSILFCRPAQPHVVEIETEKKKRS